MSPGSASPPLTSCTVLVDVARLGSMVAVTTLAVLLAVAGSKLADVTAKLTVVLAAAASATFTTRDSGGNVAPASSVGPCVQVTACPAALQLQPVPEPELKLRPAGKVVVTETLLSSRSTPAAFDTLIV